MVDCMIWIRDEWTRTVMLPWCFTDATPELRWDSQNGVVSRITLWYGVDISNMSYRSTSPSFVSQSVSSGGCRLWWLTLEEPTIPRGSWADFRALIIARYGPSPDKEANIPYHDPEIYNDMYMRRYVSYVINWHAYPNESMGHYCRRFQDAMLSYIPRDIGRPELQALHLIREGLPPETR